ncbi:MAG: YhdH/YhfP family quinone oxidoreductase [Pirellulaceae bacterium]
MAHTANCFVVDKSDGKLTRGIQQTSLAETPGADVLIDVEYSALNYKDGLASEGHPGVALSLPLVPGIDAVGKVIESQNPLIKEGDEIIVSGADFGTRCWGGWSTLAHVPAQWCIPVPPGLTGRETAILGTAGFTAAQSLEKLQEHGVTPDDGPVVVTGATGGVGIVAVCLLHKFGYHVVAVTGKPDRAEWLKDLGANEVISREEADDQSGRPILSAKWAGAIDTVGGNPLSTLLRSTRPGGCVTACGLVASHELPLTVYPFILRGVCLQGIDSANATREFRIRLWERLGSDLKLDAIEALASVTPLSEIEKAVKQILQGGIAGRTLVEVGR